MGDPVTGVWTARTPGFSHQLIFFKTDPTTVYGTDTVARGYYKGRLEGDVLSGAFFRENGQKGRFRFQVFSGGILKGVVGGVRTQAFRQSAFISRELAEFLVERKRTPGQTNEDTTMYGFGSTGFEAAMAGVSFRQGAFSVGDSSVKVPTGVNMTIPGGGRVSVGRDGVSAKAPDVEKLIEKTTGVKLGADGKPIPVNTPNAKVSATTRKFLYVVGAISVLGVGVGIWQYRRSR